MLDGQQTPQQAAAAATQKQWMAKFAKNGLLASLAAATRRLACRSRRSATARTKRIGTI